MKCRIVNRRDKTLHIFVCKLPNERDLEILRVRGWEERPSTYGIGTPSDPTTQGSVPYGTGYVFDQDVKNGATASFELPANGALLYIRGAVLVGPWFLTKSEQTPWPVRYRSDETRLLIGPWGGDSGMVKGLDGIQRHVESQYRGRIPPVFRASSDSDSTHVGLDAGSIILKVMTNLVSGAGRLSAVWGPAGAIPGGLLIASGGFMLDMLSGPPAVPRDELDLDDLTFRVQALFDDEKARTAATTLAATNNQLSFHRQHLIEAHLKSSEFGAEERQVYFRWLNGESLTSQADTWFLARVRDKIADFMAQPKWPDAERKKFAEFVRGALDSDAYGSFAWSLTHMMRNPSIMRMALPDFLLGVGLYATIAQEGIALDLEDGMTNTPNLHRDVGNKITSFVTSASEAINAVLGEMHKVIRENGLEKQPERVEVLRYYSEHFFGKPDTLHDPELRKAIASPVDSFGLRYDSLWDASVEYGSPIDTFFEKSFAIAAVLEARAKALQV